MSEANKGNTMGDSSDTTDCSAARTREVGLALQLQLIVDRQNNLVSGVESYALKIELCKTIADLRTLVDKLPSPAADAVDRAVQRDPILTDENEATLQEALHCYVNYLRERCSAAVALRNEIEVRAAGRQQYSA